MSSEQARSILVTGGNSGIGFALCRQLVVEEGCRVFMGSRDRERGEAALAGLQATLPSDRVHQVELLVVDVRDDASVRTAASSVRDVLGHGNRLYGLVNNAGVGLATGASPEEVIDTNLYGVKRMVEVFVAAGLVAERVVNVGSGSGPGYVRRCPLDQQPALCTAPADWAAIEKFVAGSANGSSGLGSAADVNGGYGLSKALLSLYTMLCASTHPDLLISCTSPGWIRTKLVGHDGPSKTPEEGTHSIKHCLCQPLEGNGWYYGSDGLRSPLHYMRNPGEPAWDGRVEGVVGVV